MATALVSNSASSPLTISLIIDFKRDCKLFVPEASEERVLTLQTNEGEIVYTLKSDETKHRVADIFRSESAPSDTGKAKKYASFTLKTDSNEQEASQVKSIGPNIKSISCRVSTTFEICFYKEPSTSLISLTFKGNRNTYLVDVEDSSRVLNDFHRQLIGPRDKADLIFKRYVTIHRPVMKRIHAPLKSSSRESPASGTLASHEQMVTSELLPPEVRQSLTAPAQRTILKRSATLPTSALAKQTKPETIISPIAQNVVKLILDRVGIDHFVIKKGFIQLKLDEENNKIANNTWLDTKNKLELIFNNLTNGLNATKRTQKLDAFIDKILDCFARIDMRHITKKEIIVALTKAK